MEESIKAYEKAKELLIQKADSLENDLLNPKQNKK